MRGKGRSPLLLMALTVFIDIAGFGLILPLLPFWAEKLGASPAQVGLILTAYALAQFLFTPLLGALSDRYGRKPIIIVSLLIEALSFALTALAGSLWFLLVARFIGGMGASNIGTAQAVVADTTTPESRARGMGLIGASIGLGFVIGPAIGGVLAGASAGLPFWAAMVVALVNAALALALLPETRTARAEAASSAANANRKSGLAGWAHTLRNPAIARLVLINFIFTLAFTAMEAVYPLFSQKVFGWQAVQNGYVFTYIGVIIVLMQGGLVARIVRRIGERVTMIMGLALLMAGLLLLPFSTTLGVMLLALALLSVGDGAVSPTSSALLSFAAAEDAQGATLGVAQGMAGLARVIAPVAAGALFGSRLGIGSPYVLGGILSALALLLALPRLPGQRVHKTAPPASGEPQAEEVHIA
jgi:DHA1 family tetracycline resistance protein-like MFS transporter